MEILQAAAGAASPVLFLKMGTDEWIPVGEESLFALVGGKGAAAAVVICDSEGNSKAMSPWLPSDQAEAAAKTLSARGLARFGGEVKLPI